MKRDIKSVYNSNRQRLIMPEYGRTVQDMIRHAMSIPNREERNRCARTIVSIMANMFPQMKDTPDFKHKLWDQLFIISEFKLDIDSPYPMPELQKLDNKPNIVPYPMQHIRLKHYGHIVEDLIAAAVATEDPERKKVMVVDIANYMKNSLLAWNKDFATDERLFNDIKILSGGRIEITEEDGLKTAAYSKETLQPNQRNNFKRQQTNKKNKNNKNNKRQNRNRY